MKNFDRSMDLVDPDLASSSIISLSPYEPGPPRDELAKSLGLPISELACLHANENVLGPSPKAIEAMKQELTHVNAYPDGGAQHLKRRIADHLGVGIEEIVVGHGSNEIIELLIRTFVGPLETVLTAWPSFVVYRLATLAQGREARVAGLREHRYDLSQIASLIDQRTKLIFIANPNNPTGTYVTKKELSAFLHRVPSNVIVVLDEAYVEYIRADDFPESLRVFRTRPRTVILRTFSKAYGLAGLRVGFGIMEARLANYLDRVRQPYNLNHLAQVAAAEALLDTEHVERTRKMTWESIDFLTPRLERLGYQVVPTQANFMTVIGQQPVGTIIQALRSKGILVRDMTGYGMPNALRITVGTEEMNLRTMNVLEDLAR